MSKCGTLLFSSFRLLLHSSNVRPLDRCCLTKAKTTMATLQFWPGYELQQHRTFASSTNSDDTEATLRKKDDKNKNQSAVKRIQKKTSKHFWNVISGTRLKLNSHRQQVLKILKKSNMAKQTKNKKK